MSVFKNRQLVMMLLVLLCLANGFWGCATSSQIQDLQEKNQQALEKTMDECESTKATAKDSFRYSAEAAASAQSAESAASRAENAMLRAATAARDAYISAQRAENMAKKCQDIFYRLTEKVTVKRSLP